MQDNFLSTAIDFLPMATEALIEAREFIYIEARKDILVLPGNTWSSSSENTSSSGARNDR